MVTIPPFIRIHHLNRVKLPASAYGKNKPKRKKLYTMPLYKPETGFNDRLANKNNYTDLAISEASAKE
jgi:hypothetical protein